ncbi:putative Zinc-ribbon domain [Trypanosoma melophagium]|uniref:putative Zinc-ribbon domain n=1 Tax=Trypanosoma melophagium TaxID=715481 RepID=UPI003519DE13|nr:putative Zinc-ribbon domain [Trypanosoma melophagium]
MLRYRSSIAREFTAQRIGTWRSFTCRYQQQHHQQVYLSAIVLGNVIRNLSTHPAAFSDENNYDTSDSTKDGNTNNIRSAGRRRELHLSRLAVVRPDLIDEWVPELNDVDVSSVPSSSSLTVWWRCAACGENYQATVRDRAVVDKGCPRCSTISSHHHQQQQKYQYGVEKGSTTEIMGGTKDASIPSLAETHPTLASRWDQEKNGLLRPTDVTSTSDLNVWWKPAEGRPPHERSFRRPVHAFVEVPYSVEEQQEAQAALELDILQEIRRAAKIEEARERDTFPAAAHLLDDLVSQRRVDTSVDGKTFSPLFIKEQRNHQQTLQEEELVGDDIHRAIEMWEKSLDVKLDPSYRPVFYFTEACDGAGVSRDEVLTTYDRFVAWHKRQKRKKRNDSCTKEDDNNNDNNSNCNNDNIVPSVITDPDWIQHFTLNVEDVVKDRFAPTARIVLPDITPTVKQKQQEKTLGEDTTTEGGGVTRRRVDSLPPPPEEYESEIRTTFASRKYSYPRRPPMPPHREDDITEGVPTMTEDKQSKQEQEGYISSSSSQSALTGEKKSTSTRKETPAEAAFEVVSLSASQSLTQEYTTSTSDKNTLFDADEKDLHLRSLLGPAALQSMTEEEARALQYNRGTPRPRRTGRFRLRPPAEVKVQRTSGLNATLGLAPSFFTDKEQSNEQQEQQQQQQVIQAPGAPRKVARPKKKRQETDEKSSSGNAVSSQEKNS